VVVNGYEYNIVCSRGPNVCQGMFASRARGTRWTQHNSADSGRRTIINTSQSTTRTSIISVPLYLLVLLL